MKSEVIGVAGRHRLLVISLVAILALSTIVLIWFGRFERQMQEPVRLAEFQSRKSPEIDRVVGRTFTLGRFVTGRSLLTGTDGTADLEIRIYGPHGRGKLQEWAQETQGRWQICSLVFQPDNSSNDIVLVPDESSRCERE